MPKAYQPRLVDAVLEDLAQALPAILLVGPRASGKTTSAARRCKTILRLDQPRIAAGVENDPDVVLADCAPPVLIDEWQLVPSILGAVKRSVDTTDLKGHYFLTGSSSDDLTAKGWPATGRIARVPVWPMNVRERFGYVRRRSIVDRFFDADFSDLALPVQSLDVRNYVDLALESGFPDLVHQENERARRTWLAGYVDQIVLRDAPLVGQDRDPQKLRSYLRAIAASTAEITSHKNLYDAAGITRMTALAFDSLLELIFVTERVPAFSTNRLNQLSRTPKRYIIEPGLLGPLLKIDARTVIRDARLVGAVIDTFVAAQLRTEVAIARSGASISHLRQADGRHEVDLILEGPGGRLVAIEIKAHASPTLEMARHLLWLQAELGNQFAAGVVLHTGPRVLKLATGIWALPISALWG
jgi:uncharacterized protein